MNKPVGVAKIIIKSSPPELTIEAVGELDYDELSQWLSIAYRIINILLEECTINTELLREWREFYFKIAVEMLNR
jgi:hypothetical protein